MSDEGAAVGVSPLDNRGSVAHASREMGDGVGAKEGGGNPRRCGSYSTGRGSRPLAGVWGGAGEGCSGVGVGMKRAGSGRGGGITGSEWGDRVCRWVFGGRMGFTGLPKRWDRGGGGGGVVIGGVVVGVICSRYVTA